jgi:type I restriction enzyme S subunit
VNSKKTKMDKALPEQRKIASFLSSLDESIESVEKKLGQSKVFKQGLLQRMFV